MPLSSDPERRKKQLANLRPAGATKHGATSERSLEPRRAKHCAELLEHFPQIDTFRLSLSATCWPGGSLPASSSTCTG